MVKAFEVGLPISNILVIEPVDHVLAQDQVRQQRVGTAAKEAGRNEICLMDRSVSPRRVAVSTCSRSQLRFVFNWANMSGEEKFRVSGSCPCSMWRGFFCTTM